MKVKVFVLLCCLVVQICNSRADTEILKAAEAEPLKPHTRKARLIGGVGGIAIVGGIGIVGGGVKGLGIGEPGLRRFSLTRLFMFEVHHILTIVQIIEYWNPTL